jgi:hypothetical protein
MGRVMPFTGPDGTEHPESFWCLKFGGFFIDGSTARLDFAGYHSAAAYDAGASPIAGAQKTYEILPDKWLESVFVPLPEPGQPFAVNFLIQTWNVALATKEGPAPAPGDPDTRVSFFAASIAAT